MSPEVREDMRFEMDYVREDLVAVQDLEWTQQIRVLLVSERHRQHSVLRLQHISVFQYATGHVRVCRRRC